MAGPAKEAIQPYATQHAKPCGPGDARPTALQILKDYSLSPSESWSSKTIFVTGASSGIGVDTAKALATTGATLYLTARNIPKARAALGSDLVESPRVHLLELDQTSLASVRACAAAFLEQSSSLHVLILNAGIRNTALGHTGDGFERQFQVNHLSHFLLVDLLLPRLLASATPQAHARIVLLSSSDHRNFADDRPVNWGDLNFLVDKSKYSPARGYTQSKLANVWTANELQRRYAAKNVDSFSVMPGGIMTGLQKGDNGNALWEILTSPKIWFNIVSIGNIMKNAEQGAATTVWAAVAPELEGKGATYLENCGVADVVKGKPSGLDPGFGTRAFDEEGEKRMWRESCAMVGIEDEIH